MEKWTPHFDLHLIQEIVSDSRSRPFTKTALAGGLALGLTETEMREIVMSLTSKRFYKSMTSYTDHQLWQDVYHGETNDGIQVYIKISSYSDGRPPIIQFKTK
ncbi:MAG: type II toxin-antitoxin system MqsR family toxin [Chlorobiaceae bacterium]|jgi:motility quorum-sensing regulator / GCU-specific mRNA interferase toxin|nr:type II toxin-antitoxin system MqsR family toxin [Chlorobiaceae bacterium]